MAENAARYLDQSYSALAKSVQRLSSGLRIVGAQDGAAGLAVRELMRADIAVLRQGARNALDAISLLQTGEAVLQVIDNILVRMKELAEQADNGTYTDTQRAVMNDEFAELAAEIDRIAAATKFNGTPILNSATGSLTVQVGTGNIADEDQITINLVDVTAEGLGLDEVDLSS